MILSYKTNRNPEYPKDLEWVMKFAWFPVRVDDGRVVWLEYVKTITRTMKYPDDFLMNPESFIY